MSEFNNNDIEIEIIHPENQQTSQLSNKDYSKYSEYKNQYCGLVNQGRTCYMNSLLQSLFMTPEFRIKMLDWQFNPQTHGEKKDSIPFQLKKLFARMQLKFLQAEKTTDLTKSFQWNAGEIYQQHDIQELCRVLFDAIKISFSGNEDFIDELFQGIITCVIKCLECGNSRQRNDVFLDLTLPVRNIFENINNNSLEMALKNYLKPEELNNDNKVICDICDKKCDALKFVKFDKLPKILFFQLGRFDYDYNTYTRIKIIDKVTFPEVLNMNCFLRNYDMISTVYSEETLKRFSERNVTDEHDKKKQIDIFLQEGPNVYELYSILIHSGNASGGHYYAYIKSLETGKWYNFNDSTVTEINVECIQFIYGGDSKSSNTAYILMYRLSNSNNGNINIDNSIICDEFKSELIAETEKIREAERIEKEKANNIIIKFKYNNKDKEITFKKSYTIRDLKLQAIRQYEIVTDEKNARLRVIDISNNKYLESYPVEDFTLEESNIVSYKVYSLEIRVNEDIPFEDYDPTAIIIDLYLWEDTFNEIEEKDFKFYNLKISKNAKLSTLKERIYETLKIDFCKSIYCFKKLEFSTPELFNSPSMMNKEICLNSIYDKSKIYIEVKDENWKSSLFLKRFEKKKLNIIISFNLPLAPEDVKAISINSYKFDNQIQLPKSTTIKEMKAQIGQYLQLNINEFIIKKSSHYGDELNILSENLFKFDSDSINIYVEFGQPMREEEIKISALHCEYDNSKFMIYPYRIQEFGTFYVDINQNIASLKDMLCNELKRVRNIELDKNYLLLREHLIDKPTRIYPDNEVIKTLNFNKNKRIILQEYKKERLVADVNQIQLTVREYDQSKWSLSEPIEILIDKKANIEVLITLILKQFPNIKKENLLVYKLLSIYNLFLEDFNNKIKFEKLAEKTNSKLDGFPFFITNDGSFLIIKDETKEYREPTENERTIHCRPVPITKPDQTCTAIVAVNNDNKEYVLNEETGEKKVKSVVSQFESLIVNPLANLWNSAKKSGLFQTKEEGIKINVKKSNYEEKILEDNVMFENKMTNDKKDSI